MAKAIGAKVTKIKPKKVRIADKDVVMVNGYCTFEAKIGDLPKERITDTHHCRLDPRSSLASETRPAHKLGNGSLSNSIRIDVAI